MEPKDNIFLTCSAQVFHNGKALVYEAESLLNRIQGSKGITDPSEAYELTKVLLKALELEMGRNLGVLNLPQDFIDVCNTYEDE